MSMKKLNPEEQFQSWYKAIPNLSIRRLRVGAVYLYPNIHQSNPPRANCPAPPHILSLDSSAVSTNSPSSLSATLALRPEPLARRLQIQRPPRRPNRLKGIRRKTHSWRIKMPRKTHQRAHQLDHNNSKALLQNATDPARARLPGLALLPCIP